jgi:hypothetical protein
MSTDANELQAFQDFLAGELNNGSRDSLTQVLTKFRAHQDEATKFREHLQGSIDQANRGEAQELDREAVRAEIRDELAEEGITERCRASDGLLRQGRSPQPPL